jgi:FAD/FMN-containing dehydrogenase
LTPGGDSRRVGSATAGEAATGDLRAVDRPQCENAGVREEPRHEEEIELMALSRRDFLARSASVVAGAVAAPVLSPFVARGASAATTCTASSSALAALAKGLAGRLVLPCDSDFALASAIHNPSVDAGPPIAVLQAANADDVAAGIAFARTEGVPLAGMSGGHGYAGYSSTHGLQISFAQMNAVSVDAATRLATIGAGANLDDVYSGLAKAGYLVPGGSCTTVGVAGLTLGGGFGLSGRQFGLLTDNLVSATIVTADGQKHTVSESNEADLFWALRGGGGGNFGLVTEFVFNAHPTADVIVFNIGWEWSKVREVFDAWQNLIPDIPDELTTISTIGNNGLGGDTSGLTCATVGQFRGSEADLREILQPLYDAGGTPKSEDIQKKSFIDSVYYFAWCSDEKACQKAPVGTVEPARFYIKSAYARERFPQAGVGTMIDWIERWPGENGYAVFEFDSYGGAVNRVSPTATAFVHREELLVGQHQVYWDDKASESMIANAVGWLNGFYAAMAPYNSGFAYQNYIDRNLADWQHAYYGENLPRLRQVKRRVDPDNLFNFAQSIPPADG